MPSTPFSSPRPSQNSSAGSESIYRSPQMRKEALRNVFVNAQALQSHINTNTVENLENMINEVDVINQEGSLEDKIKDQSEVLLDSEIMSISSHVLKKCTLSLSKNISSYDPIELASKLRNYVERLPDTMRDEELQWSLLRHEILPYFGKRACFSMLLGALKIAPKKEVIRRKAVREAQAPTKRPENVISLDKTEDSVEQTVIKITSIIRNYQKQHKKPLDFFSLVLHPTDFGKTIENILHVSFLVRDGIVTFITDEDGIPHVYKTSKDDLAAAKANRKKKNIQNVLSLTMTQWRALVEAYNIERPMIDLSTTKK